MIQLTDNSRSQLTVCVIAITRTRQPVSRLNTSLPYVSTRQVCLESRCLRDLSYGNSKHNVRFRMTNVICIQGENKIPFSQLNYSELQRKNDWPSWYVYMAKEVFLVHRIISLVSCKSGFGGNSKLLNTNPYRVIPHF